MMLKLFGALLLVSAACAIVCPPNYCDSVNCPQIKAEDCHGRLSTEGSVCGCCEACIRWIDVDQPCPFSALRGVPLRAECKPGLVCDPSTNVCKRPSP
ncbi:uncharacterized protein LOC142560714 [Dermacentor variabilis]|uniref:uncharacterized protein LOC142560714 n=1 Tax=Dermacentor variabilis TaxID=34621 RepID=UPI003F5AFB14